MRTSRLSLGIIGCGWLGRALAQKALAKGIDVVATTQSKEKQAALEHDGITAHQLVLPFIDNSQHLPVFDSDVIVICITPQIRQGKKDYPDKIEQLVTAARQSKVTRIILISTTAAYEGLSGEVNEQSELCLQNDKAALINSAEQHVLTFSDNSVVLRCAGLVGPNRHPGQFFKANRQIKSANAYVNLVHQFDVVEQLILLLNNASIGGVYNCVSAMKVNKKFFYQQAAKALNKECPDFEHNDNDEKGRLVLGTGLRNKLNYQYQFDDLVAWLSDKPIETRE